MDTTTNSTPQTASQQTTSAGAALAELADLAAAARLSAHAAELELRVAGLQAAKEEAAAQLKPLQQAVQEGEERLSAERLAHRRAVEGLNDQIKALHGRVGGWRMCWVANQRVNAGFASTVQAPSHPPQRTHKHTTNTQLAACQDGAQEAQYQVAAARAEVHVLLSSRSGVDQQLKARNTELQVCLHAA